tara:strand:+ start:503 stop:1111 length:609 start_codon:yes stop_codon:yes gene_type:complete
MKQTEFSTAPASIALYGGSFDPVHCAHLCVAAAALQQINLDQVLFIPAAQSPLKTNTAVASDAQRIEMLRLAIAEEPRFMLDSSEIDRGGRSYTIDTVTAYRLKYPACKLHWIIGADQFELLPQWHKIEDLASLVTFIVVGRPGHSTSKTLVPGLKYLTIEAPLMPHSSSEIRSLLAQARSTEDLLPPTVEAFISAHGLYTQ